MRALITGIGGFVGRHLLQHLLRSATTVAIVTTDRAGAITLVNAGAEAMLRIPTGASTEHRLLEFLDPAEVAARMAERGEIPGHGLERPTLDHISLQHSRAPRARTPPKEDGHSDVRA